MRKVFLKYMKEEEDALCESKKAIAHIRQKMNLIAGDLEQCKFHLHASTKSKELKSVEKFFKDIIIVPTAVGIYVELGNHHERKKGGYEEFFVKNGFVLTSDPGTSTYYLGPEGHKYFIAYGPGKTDR